ncbi:MAG: amidohydrolase family protein [Canibacter sp.]
MNKVIEYQAPWIIGFQDGEHRVLENGAIVIDGDTIVHVGRRGQVPSAEIIETSSIIAPGFISLHCHMNESPVDKGLAEDMDKRQFWSTNLIEILPPRSQALSTEDAHVCARISVAEHIRTGATTVMQMGIESDYIAELCKKVGLRAYIAEAYRSGRWFTDDGLTVQYDWAEDDGFADFNRGLEFARRYKNPDHKDLVTGFLNPSQVDTCSERLLRATKQASEEEGFKIQIHAAQSYSEFHEMTRRHGLTPVEWLDRVGLLGPNTLIGHGLFLTGTSWTNFHGDDLGILARSGTGVVYNPWVFGRNGIAMETFAEYGRRGVPVTLGTDTTTQSILLSARWASIITKILEKRSDVGEAREMFNALTVRAAESLGRDDLGRLAPGAKADMVFWKPDSIFTTPLRDPIRNIIYYAEAQDIEQTIISGKPVYQDGMVNGLDESQDLADLQKVSERVWENWQRYDWADRSVDTHVPASYSPFELD